MRRAALRVHSRLGPGLLESAYRACLAHELRARGRRVAVEAALPLEYDEVRLDVGYRVDVVVDDPLIVEIKAVARLLPIHEAQLLSYPTFAVAHFGRARTELACAKGPSQRLAMPATRRSRAIASIAAILCALGGATAGAQTPTYLDTSATFAVRARDLVARMTLDEKVSQMMDVAPAIDRLGVPAYNWWNEALHGVARSGLATVFPQAIGLAATWDDSLMFGVATTISDEARAKHEEYVRNGSRGRYQGLTFWSPNVNLFRDPRWGRGQETYGEDPFLTGRLAVQFVRGMQGDDRRYLKTVSTLKHFAVHSGPESSRHRFDARPSERDLQESYLPHFEMGIELGGARSVMCAYNRIDGAPACASDLLLGTTLRGAWGFRGYVVSDCGAIDDIFERHRVVATAAEASAMAVKAGTDLECGDAYRSLVDAVRRGLVSEAAIDTAVVRLFEARFALGMFDPPSMVKWARIPSSDLDSPAHRALARRAARESMVLLKNARHTLPLRKDLRSIAVIGPNADDAEVLLGNYNGTPADPVTVLRGVREAVSATTKVSYARGSDLAAELAPGVDSTHPSTGTPARARADSLLSDALVAARTADAVVLVLGLSPRIEGEEMPVHIPGFAGGDRTTLDLPPAQERLLERVVALGRPTVLVLLNGGALSIGWAKAHVPAIVEAWYPGQAGGSAVADVIFGDANPGGRLPVTFYRSVRDLPPFDDYAMAGHTYRFFSGTPLFPFGFGLSYTTFSYAGLRTSAAVLGAGDTLAVSVDVTNTGQRAGDEVVQLYARHLGSSVARPRRDLRGYARVSLAPGETRTVTMRVPARSLAYWDTTRHGWRLESDRVRLEVGGSSADARLTTVVRVQGDR